MFTNESRLVDTADAFFQVTLLTIIISAIHLLPLTPPILFLNLSYSLFLPYP